MKRESYKRWLALCLAVALCVTMMPAAVSAAPYRIETGKPASQSSEREMTRQVIEELLQDTITAEAPLNDTFYAQEVIDEINRVYRETIEYVIAHPQEVETDGFFVYIPVQVAEGMEALEMLVTLQRNVYNSSRDNQTLKKLLQEQYSQIVEKVERSDYNDWYWDMYVRQRESAKQKISAVKDLKSYIEAAREQLFVSFPADEEDVNPEDIDAETLSDFFYEIELTEYAIVTKTLIETAITIGQRELDNDLAVAEEDKLFTPSKKLTDAVAGFKRAAGAEEDLNVIFEKHQAILELFDKEYEAARKASRGKDSSAQLSGSDRMRWAKKMQQQLNARDHNDYSETAYETIVEIYDKYLSRLELCDTQKEAATVFNRYIAELKKVPTQTAEVKAARAKVIRDWKKKYGKKKKYDPKKVKKALAEGTKALQRVTSMEALEAVAEKYTAKLDNTVYRFRVKVTKSGKGTVTKSSKVKYGGKFILKIKPSPGHALKSVTINGKKQSKLKYRYRIRVTKKAAIRVVFR